MGEKIGFADYRISGTFGRGCVGIGRSRDVPFAIINAWQHFGNRKSVSQNK
ncbi:MAG: hypothetical protein J1E35_10475 [Lachnospiraceae bacterium]|nr:hypothetical protein [Lachnospiraceae bacterium]